MVHFHKSNVDEKDFWQSSDYNIFSHIWESKTAEKVMKQPEKKSKIIVVFELPTGGKVSQFNVGESDDTLKLEI